MKDKKTPVTPPTQIRHMKIGISLQDMTIADLIAELVNMQVQIETHDNKARKDAVKDELNKRLGSTKTVKSDKPVVEPK